MSPPYEYQLNGRFFAQVAEGLEQLAAEEISELKAENIRTAYRGVHFQADPEALYTINYNSRIISRVLAPLLTFQCHSYDYLYRRARAVEWSDLFSADQTFAVFSNVSNSKIRHSQYAAQCLKDAIVDYFKAGWNRRPSVEKVNPDVWISLHIENNRAALSLDTSRGPLHRRGYREQTVTAVMQETLAAAVIRLTSWDGSLPLYDPMCGSGTLLSEALMLYCRIPSGRLRTRFGFESLPDFDPVLWKKIRERAEIKIRDFPEGLIAGSDLSRRAVEISRTNLKNLPYGDKVEFRALDFRKLQNMENRVIVCDPPYGIRLRGKEDLPMLYKAFGDFLKQKCKGSTAFVYLGNRDLMRNIGLKPSWKIPLLSGGLDGRLVKYELY